MAKIIYIANMRLPTEKAHGIQIMKMCEAFARNGAEVELVVPRRINFIKRDPFEYYGVKRNFKIVKVPSLDLLWLPFFKKLWFWIQSLSFAEFSSWYVLFKNADIIYSRDELPLFYLSFFKKNIVWELHTKKFTLISRNLFKKNIKIITITENLKNYCLKYNPNPANILVAHDAVDIKEFDISTSKDSAREKLNLPKDKILIGYVGMFKTMGKEKGVGAAIKSLKYLPEDVILVLVGGDDNDIIFYKKLAGNLGCLSWVIFTGRASRQLVPLYLKSFDILLAPFPNEEHYRYYMSPLKVFEYMASGRPIIASDLPSIREVLSENSSILIPPDDINSLAGGIRKILRDPMLADKISKQARKDVEKFTWDKRGKNILEFIGRNY